MAILDSINEAKKRGASDDDIINEIIKQNPQRKTTFDEAKRRGANATQILDEIIRQNGGSTTTTQTSQPATPQVEEKKGFNLIEMIKNIPSSGGRLVGDVATAITHPVETATTLGKAALGVAEKVLPGENFGEIGKESENITNQIFNMYKERYGGIDKAAKTLQEDPVGFAADIAALFTGAGGLAKGAAGIAGKTATTASKLGSVSKTASTVGKALENVAQTAFKIGDFTDPITGTLKTIGMAGEKFTPKTIGGFKLDDDVIKLEKKYNLDLPASAKTKSPVVPIIESLGGKGLFGEDLVKKLEVVGQELNNIANEAVERISITGNDAFTLGQNIEKSFNGFKDNWIKQKNKLYEKVSGLNEIKITKELRPTETISLLESVIKREKGASKIISSSDLVKFQKMFRGLSRSRITAQNIKDAFSKMNDLAKSSEPFATKNKALLQKIASTLENDFEKIVKVVDPKIGKALDVANAFYKQGIEKINSVAGKNITKAIGENRYDEIVNKLVNSKTSKGVTDIVFEIIGSENKTQIQRMILEDIFKKARGNSDTFKPTGISTQLKNWGDNLNNIFDEKTVKTLEDLDKLAKSLSKGQKVFSGSQTAFMIRIVTELGQIFVNPLNALLIIFGDSLFSKFISLPIGQKLLTQGWSIPEKFKIPAKFLQKIPKEIRYLYPIKDQE